MLKEYKVKNRGLYKVGEVFKVSRAKIELFLECPRCFYLDRRLGISRPKGAAFSLNVAVDELLKKEFDIHRAKGSTHPLMKEYKIKAVPIRHEKLNDWRENRIGVQYLHSKTKLLIFGAIDDLWKSSRGEHIVVDYKATSKAGEVELTDAKWHMSYRRQMEIYQWLLRKNGLKVSKTGYFVYVNGKKDRKDFDGRLDFDIKLIPYIGSDKWIEQAVLDIFSCLNRRTVPKPGNFCEYCPYTIAVSKKIT